MLFLFLFVFVFLYLGFNNIENILNDYRTQDLDVYEQAIVAQCIQQHGLSNLKMVQERIPFQSLRNIVRTRKKMKNARDLIESKETLWFNLPPLNCSEMLHHCILVEFLVFILIVFYYFIWFFFKIKCFHKMYIVFIY